MFCISIFGMELAVDFTAPALLGLLSIYLPQKAFLQMCAACLLHESAHLLMMRLLSQRPAGLRLSAAGMQLSIRSGMLCPLPALTAILLSGAAANFAAALCFFACGDKDSAGANLSLALFNLLPYRSTDGGTLIAALLEHRLIAEHPERVQQIMRLLCIAAALTVSAGLIRMHSRNLSLWSMLLFMTASELTGDPVK